jgi:hypothetical protein
MRRALGFLLIVTLGLSFTVCMADCGKVPIPPCRPGENPDPGPTTVPTEPVVQSGNGDINDGSGEVPSPSEPSEEDLEKMGSSLGGFFHEDLQQGVIGWNGEQEVLILSTNEESLVGDTAMLSIMPLPGKPIEIAQGDKKAFSKAKKLILSKAAIPVGATSLGLFMEKTIGAHNIFVWKIDAPKDFAPKVQAYISRKYGGKAKALLTQQTLNVIKSYYDRGFRYFAFDLVTVRKDKSTKEAIAYHFDSKFVYYPMVISSVGGTGKTVVDLAVFTKGEITKLSGIERKHIIKLGDKTVSINQSELKEIDPRLAGLFPADSTLTGRVLLIHGKLQEFKKDFIGQ